MLYLHKELQLTLSRTMSIICTNVLPTNYLECIMVPNRWYRWYHLNKWSFRAEVSCESSACYTIIFYAWNSQNCFFFLFFPIVQFYSLAKRRKKAKKEKKRKETPPNNNFDKKKKQFCLQYKKQIGDTCVFVRGLIICSN